MRPGGENIFRAIGGGGSFAENAFSTPEHFPTHHPVVQPPTIRSHRNSSSLAPTHTPASILRLFISTEGAL